MSRGYSQALTLPFLHFKFKGNQSIVFGKVPYFPQIHSCVNVISFGGLYLRGWGIIQQQHQNGSISFRGGLIHNSIIPQSWTHLCHYPQPAMGHYWSDSAHQSNDLETLAASKTSCCEWGVLSWGGRVRTAFWWNKIPAFLRSIISH